MNLREKYNKEILPAMKEKFGYKNSMAVPKLKQVVINVGVGKFSKEEAYLATVEKTLINITGQKPVRTKAKKSIATFKIREGMIVGIKVSLRKQRMYDFIEKLVHVTLPRTRDFRGLSTKGIDKAGNFSIGLKEHLAFPEIRPEDVEKNHGMEICIATTAETKEEGLELLKLMGFPFKKDNPAKKTGITD